MGKTKSWVPLESNPDVLNDFGQKIGLDVARYAFCDVFGLDEELLAMVPQPVLAVLMCFPITAASEAAAKAEDEAITQQHDTSSMPFYLKQTVGNACGTIAIIHAVCNNENAIQAGVLTRSRHQAEAFLHVRSLPLAYIIIVLWTEPSAFLRQFVSSTKSMTPEQRGAYLEAPPEGAPDIESAHQAAAAEGVTAPPAADEDVDLHFVAFVHKEGRLWQLDGRRRGPIDHGPTTQDALLHDTAHVVRGFVERSNSVKFNLIALAASE